MPNPSTLQRLRQKKLDTLVSRNLHRPRIAYFNRLNLLVDLMALAVPIGYFAVRFLAKNTSWQHSVEIIWELSAGLLLVLSIVKLVRKWPEHELTHTNLMTKDLSFIAHVDYLMTLYENNSVTDDAINIFILSADQDNDDAVTLANVRPTEKQAAFREALKEIYPSSPLTVCPTCNASPWYYTPGPCQACGNTPQEGAHP